MRVIIGKEEKPEFSWTNFIIGVGATPGVGVIWGNLDFPTKRPRRYYFKFSDGTQEEVSGEVHQRYNVGDNYPDA